MSTFLTIILVALTVTVVIGLITFFSTHWFSHIAVRPGRAGNDGVSAGLRPELVAAKSWAKDGAWKKAIQIAEAELAKEPSHYEGNLLLAEWHAQLGHWEKARPGLHRILSSPAATEAQKAVARQWLLDLHAYELRRVH